MLRASRNAAVDRSTDPGDLARQVVSSRTRVPEATGLSRERLTTSFAEIWRHRLTLVVAPAGSGKTTLLAQFTATVHCPLAWYRAEPGDADRRTLLRYLESALCRACPSLTSGWETVEDATLALEAWPGRQVVLVIDDLHELDGTPALEALAQLLDYAAPKLTVVAAARAEPRMNLSRLAVEDRLFEIGPDELRFRSWEVEQLFSEFYGQPLRPEDLAELARRTEGWAAGLQLFHLATSGRRVDQHRATLDALGVHGRLGRQYLTDNVLQHLPVPLRSFLIDTSVLGRLSGPLCDALLGRTGSGAILADLERRRLFTIEVEEGWYRYHEVLRSHLEACLVEQAGEVQARVRFRQAGELLAQAELPAEALSAFCRAEDWEAVDRVLGTDGEALAAAGASWLDALPPALRQRDPWVGLAAARRLRADGRWPEAVDTYHRVESQLPPLASDTARRERQTLATWLGPPGEWGGDGWNALLRAATVRDPLAVVADAARLPRPYDHFVAGMGMLLAGRALDARSRLREATADPDAPPLLAAGAQLAAVAATLLVADDETPQVEQPILEAERLGARWLTDLARCLLAPARPNGAQAATGRGREGAAETWDASLAALLTTLAVLHQPGRADSPTPLALADVAEVFRAVGAETLGVWCDALDALAVARRDGDAGPAREASDRARRITVPGAEAVARLAASIAEPRGGRLRAEAEELLASCGLSGLAGTIDAEPAAPVPGRLRVRVRCFGRFELEIDGETVDLSGLKPRARSLLRLLALRANRPVHREVIAATLWPDAGADSGTRSLHVALSALRHAVEPDAERGSSSLIERDGESYRLVIDEAGIDVARFERTILAGRAAGTRDPTRAVAAWREAVELYRGELLPEEGPVDWVVDERRRYRAKAAEAAEKLAALLAEREHLVEAASACEQALQWDAYRDPAWQLLIAVHERAGNPAAAAMTRQRYADLLTSLDADG